MMRFDARFDCAAAMASLAEARAFVEEFCRQQAIDPRDALRLTLLLEELLTNTVNHGHGGDSDAPVRLELHADAARVTLVYADTAPPFDPLAWQRDDLITLSAPLEDRPVGQVGIALVLRMAADARYERRNGWNRLQLELERQT